MIKALMPILLTFFEEIAEADAYTVDLAKNN